MRTELVASNVHMQLRTIASPANPTSHNKPPCSVAYAPSVPVVLPWVPRGGLGQRGRLARTAVRPKPRFPVWRGRGLCGGCPLEVSPRRFCRAIPVVPPRPVSAAATEHRSAECPGRTLVKSASEPHTVAYNRSKTFQFKKILDRLISYRDTLFLGLALP